MKPCLSQNTTLRSHTNKKTGVDVHADDALGRLDVSTEGLARRELLVLDTCLGAGVPVAGYVGGGYDADLDVLADRHILLFEAARRMWVDHEL